MKISNLPTWQKLALLSLASVLLAAVPTTLLVRNLNATAATAAREASGAQAARALMEAMRLMQQHRGLSNGVLSGNASLAPQRDAKKAEVGAGLAALQAALADGGGALAGEVAAIAQAWSALAQSIDQRRASARESFQAHTELIARVLRLLDALLDAHGLSLDADPATRHLIAATYQALPPVTESLGQARAMGTAILTTRAPAAEDRVFVAALLDRTVSGTAAVRLSLDKAMAADPALAAVARDALAALEAETAGTVQVARREVVDAKELAFPAADYFALTTRTIDSQFRLNDVLTGTLGTLLAQRASRAAWTRNAVLAGALATLLAVSLLAWVIVTAVTRPLGEAVRIAGQIASGRLDNRIPAEGRDEVAQLMRALQDMQRQLLEIVRRIQEASHAIRDASSQAAAGNTDLSARTEEQASSLEETAANMEELTGAVKQNAESADAAIDLARGAAAKATHGGEIVSTVVTTMGALAEGSRRVAEITETIDGIAFQTNLLALNAAVEAARAGEHGRGFAVVAAEVRGLSQRCAQAAQQIRLLVRDSVEGVEAGRRQADAAGASMVDIVASVREVAQRVADIAGASSQQRAGIEQVNQAISQMESVTQQNAALVEEAAANAMSLQQQALELSRIVATFSTGDARHPARAPVPGARSLPPRPSPRALPSAPAAG